ncbi:MAG: MarR family winged helix-turn-helix transcriptional regulator [Bosea sp. (in: a-proteobacteria)]
MSETATHPDLTVHRLREGLDRLAAVSRGDLWSATSASGLNPAQAQALALLARRGALGLRVKEVAAHLGVSQPTATDTIAALERKGFVKRLSDPDDARATIVRVTDAGQMALTGMADEPSALGSALALLAPDEQADLLVVTIKLIRNLQIAGAIPVQRMCVNCRHFRPNIHADAANPHHCAFVNAAFGDRLLRLDCGDHEPADPALQSANWMAFDKGSASLQAPSQP